ncbi:MAG TPA: flagellar hook-associated protein FlgL [Geobacteraceae bacterium]|nr:flagellar hook-associated protein FlgL [Geobacteraceae bacterium]
MRVTENMTMNMVLASLQKQQDLVNNLQQQISTGQKINEPSDDPVSAQQSLDLKGLIATTDQYTRNIQTGTSWLSQMDSSMSEMNNVLVRAKELATQMSNGTYDAGQRQSAALEVTQLRDQMIALGNTQIAGKYVFGGYVSDQPPFDATTGSYNGTEDDVNIQISQGSSMTINYSGGKLLRGSGGGTDVIGTLNDLVTALNNDDQSGVAATITGLDDSLQQIQAAQGDVGARENRLQTAGNVLSNTKDNLTKALSGKEDADYLQVMSDLSKQQTAYQATLAATAKFSQLSLLDYMQ